MLFIYITIRVVYPKFGHLPAMLKSYFFLGKHSTLQILLLMKNSINSNFVQGVRT